MWEKTCNHCGECKPNGEFERRGNGHRNTCRRCRNRIRAGERLSRCQPAEPRKPPQAMPTEVNNSFALWFGPVDRHRTIRPTL